MAQSLQNIVQFPRNLSWSASISAVVLWASALNARPAVGPPILPITWAFDEDTDGAILLVPVDDAEPGFAITRMAREYEVLVCDPEDMDQLGPYETLSAALDGITHWLKLPSRMVEIGPGITTFGP